MKIQDLSYPIIEPPFFSGSSNTGLDKAKVLILPIAYEATAYGKTGSKEGPKAIISASREIEIYDLETEKDIGDINIYTLPTLNPSKNSTQDAMLDIKKAVRQILRTADRFPLILGGEHSITLGVLQAFIEKYPDLCVLHLDAHADVADQLEGSKIHHGTFMRRVMDELNIPVVQVGIRSISKEEAQYLQKRNQGHIFYAKDYQDKLPVSEIIKALPTPHVYLTFDLDFLDPSSMPATGTPVPGGYSYQQTIPLLKELMVSKKVVGADLVELTPTQEHYHAEVLAAQLAFKIIFYQNCN